MKCSLYSCLLLFVDVCAQASLVKERVSIKPAVLSSCMLSLSCVGDRSGSVRAQGVSVKNQLKIKFTK